MPERIAELRKEFDSIVTEAKAFFEEVGRRGISSIDDWGWRFLTDEEEACANELRRRIRCLLTHLATPFQASPLLDNQDFRKFVRIGRARDATVHFQSFRRVGIEPSEDPPFAPGIVRSASEELRELLDLIPVETLTAPPVVQSDANSGSAHGHGTACEQRPESEKPPTPVAS